MTKAQLQEELKEKADEIHLLRVRAYDLDKEVKRLKESNKILLSKVDSLRHDNETLEYNLGIARTIIDMLSPNEIIPDPDGGQRQELSLGNKAYSNNSISKMPY